MRISSVMRAAASTLAVTALLGGFALSSARADCGPAAKDALGNSLNAGSGTTVPGTPTTGAASERSIGSGGQGAAQERVGSQQNALGNNLGANTGTTAPGTPTTGAASERQQMASNSRSAAQDRDCK
jgi:hypothetical protein